MSMHKRLYWVFVLSIIFGLIGFKSANADMAIGGYIGYTYERYGMETSISRPDYGFNLDMDASLSNNSISFSVFFNLTYLRVGVGYTTIIGDTKITFTTETAYQGTYEKYTESKNENCHFSFLNIFLLGKLPFDLGDVKIWPAVGIGYDLNLIAKHNDEDIKSDSALSDFFILAGLGADIKVTEEVFISSSIIYGYNLTPDINKEKISDLTYSGWKIYANLGIGYTF